MDESEPQVMLQVVEATMSSPMSTTRPGLPVDPVEADLARPRSQRRR